MTLWKAGWAGVRWDTWCRQHPRGDTASYSLIPTHFVRLAIRTRAPACCPPHHLSRQNTSGAKVMLRWPALEQGLLDTFEMRGVLIWVLSGLDWKCNCVFPPAALWNCELVPHRGWAERRGDLSACSWVKMPTVQWGCKLSICPPDTALLQTARAPLLWLMGLEQSSENRTPHSALCLGSSEGQW